MHDGEIVLKITVLERLAQTGNTLISKELFFILCAL